MYSYLRGYLVARALLHVTHGCPPCCRHKLSTSGILMVTSFNIALYSELRRSERDVLHVVSRMYCGPYIAVAGIRYT